MACLLVNVFLYPLFVRGKSTLLLGPEHHRKIKKGKRLLK
ncbi:hypothetical protein X474_14025 [Dethiosulfatarculus sandiegensis]|uniref:Uncharacterized protein n=1 Tax=Dethiosulfatarculus sandiegensis TaxID=1429043 RepID=A0A0D2GEL8_9BACT|nr:hypothetical protein X474_14025 [Dethiosulfatarculus sandiegensis]